MPEAKPKVEVGWIAVGQVDGEARDAVDRARERFAATMSDAFGGFDWRVSPIRLPQVRLPDDGRGVEPVDALDVALAEREARHLDYAIAFVNGELVGYEKPHLIAAPSAAINCATASLQRLRDGLSGDGEPGRDADEVVDALAGRVHTLACHLLGHLAGLGDSDDAGDFMHHPEGVADLDRERHFGEASAGALRRELADAADPRLEEREAHSRVRSRAAALAFALRAAWNERDDVWRILVRLRPWAIPLRLGRLVTAAASTLLILIITAEAWEAGMSQPTWRVVTLGGLSLVVASAYLIYKQRLLIRRPRVERKLAHRRAAAAPFSEQRSVGNVAVILGVIAGMAVMYAILFAATLIVAVTFFPADVVESWAASVGRPLAAHEYLQLAGSVAAVALAIGALGASFEPRGYVRHVAYVDEEV